MVDSPTVRAQECAKVYTELLCAAAKLDTLRTLESGYADCHVTSAMHAVRFAATMLWPTVPHMPRPGYRYDSERLLDLTPHWREAALGLGEFAPPSPDPRIVDDTAPPA